MVAGDGVYDRRRRTATGVTPPPITGNAPPPGPRPAGSAAAAACRCPTRAHSSTRHKAGSARWRRARPDESTKNNPWLDALVDSLRAVDSRWGYNGKPTRTASDNNGFPVIAAGDEVAYHYGAGASLNLTRRLLDRYARRSLRRQSEHDVSRLHR